MEKISKQLRFTIFLLVLLNAGMAGLYALVVPIYSESVTTSRTIRGPVADRWFDVDGIEHSVITEPFPDEPFAQLVSRHKTRTAVLREAFPERPDR